MRLGRHLNMECEKEYSGPPRTRMPSQALDKASTMKRTYKPRTGQVQSSNKDLDIRTKDPYRITF